MVMLTEILEVLIINCE